MVAELNVSVRTGIGRRSVARLRRQGRIPAVLYGRGQPGTLLEVDGQIFNKLLYAGERVVVLKFDGQQRQALIKDIQYDALGEQTLHIDFNELRAGQKVTVRVPVALKGTAKGQADGGVVNQLMHELEIESLPAAIPEKIIVAVDGLDLGQSLRVSDLALPEGVTAVSAGSETVASCEQPREEEVEEVAAEAATEPEVLTEKKEGDAGEEAAKDTKDSRESEEKK